MSDFIGLLGGRASSGSGRDKEVNALSRATLGYRVRPLAVLGHPRDPPGASPEAHSGRRKVPRDGLGARRNPRRGKGVKGPPLFSTQTPLLQRPNPQTQEPQAKQVCYLKVESDPCAVRFHFILFDDTVNENRDHGSC